MIIIGVAYVQDGVQRVVKNKNGIILSVGAIGSPHILLLSGIGPASQLNESGIKTISDLPVGQNLRDHMFIGVENVLPSGHEWYDMVIYPSTIMKLDVFYQYLVHGSGPLSSLVSTSIVFLRTCVLFKVSSPTLLRFSGHIDKV